MTVDLDTAETQARALLDSRIESVRALVQARQHTDQLRQQLADAERDDTRLYQAALRDGWTAEELRKIGLTEPGKPTSRSTSRARRRRAPDPSPGPAPRADANRGDDGHGPSSNDT